MSMKSLHVCGLIFFMCKQFIKSYSTEEVLDLVVGNDPAMEKCKFKKTKQNKFIYTAAH